MARITQLKKLTLDRNVAHQEVECTYSIVDNELQIDTYGSDQRKILGKKSQSMRFSTEAIEQLKRILEEL